MTDVGIEVPAVGARPAPRTVVERFRARVATQPGRPALRYHHNGDWRALDWGEYGQAVDEVAAGLVTLGIEPGDRVGLLSGNRPEWHIADLAILSVGAVTVPVYPTSSSPQVAYVLADSGARVCFVDSPEQLAKVLLHRSDLPDLERIVGLLPMPGLDHVAIVLDLAQLRGDGRGHLAGSPTAIADRAGAIAADDLATLVYTSGTTGPPKGAILTHGNLGWTVDAVESMVGLSPEDRLLSYLPLSHIAERLTSHIGQIASGGETWFAQSLATVPEDLRACRPTIFFAVPRVWQKFHDAILDKIAESPKPVRLALERYVALGKASVEAGEQDRELSSTQRRLHLVLDRTIGAKLRKQLGLDEARIIVSSAAPIHPDLVRWFHGIGIPIAEVWGQTEDCGPATLNPPEAIRIGSVGLPLPGLEVRVADDGELMVRGGSVCRGYYRQPEATATLIDPDGWMSTGDLGAIDDDGYVRITGRKSDLIITAAGKNISPSEIESRLALEPLIGQAVVVGDGRKYLVALITLDPDDAADWAARHGAFADISSLINDPALRGEVAAGVERVNREHAPVEQIKHWRLLHEPFTVEGGELTPTMKVKRAFVMERYADLVEEMYTEAR
ncbi:MAG TPA: long-chain fatty acid--CoA ligase [Ilumatobacter sp.]|nr:long-chain fatty acid--CoA ligase [Ilumatobacter sp.]